MNRNRIEAIMRLLVDSGDMTPMAVRQIQNVMDAEEAKEGDLRGLVREAIEFADDGWAYASDYFREKWGYAEQRRALLARAL